MKRINKKALILVIALVALIMSCFAIFALADDGDKTDAMIAINADEKLQGAFLKKMTLADDGYIGIPAELSFYYDYATHGKANPIGYLDPEGDAVALYVVNSNVERIGTKSDAEIIGGLLDRGYVVAVLDYLNNEKAKTPDIDWSAQGIREKLYKGSYFSDISDKVGVGTYVTNFIIPAGYDILPFQLFWEIDKHGADGDIEKIVENWNTDFRSSQNRDKLVYWADADGNRKATWNAPDGSAPVWLNASGKEDANGKYIRVKYTKAESIGDCVNPDGTPLDLNLYAHVIYPTNPEQAVPVMNLASCGLYLSSAPTSEDEYCDFTGFLFNGYAGMIYDYLWYPMARQYGYYDGNSANGAVTGDHMNYSLHIWNDKLVNTAAMRYIRHLAVDESETFKLDTDHMGVIGLSKGSWFDFLGEAELRNYTVDNPEDYTADELMELIDARIAAYTPKRYLEGHHGETRYQAGNTTAYTDGGYTIDGGERQPWLLYETTGEEILAFTSYNYTACGTNQEDITAGHVPMFNSHALNDSFGNAQSTVGPLAANMDIPTLDFVCDIYHAMAYGPDEHYGIDTYRAQFAFANYFLKDTPISVVYVDPVGNTTGLKLNEDITIAFAGTATYECMFDITLTDSNGNAVSGDWISSRGGTTWTFKHDTLKGGETYTLTVPATFVGTNGKAMGEAYSVQFKTVSENAYDGTVENNYVTVTVPETIPSGAKLGFTVEDDAYNTADIYLVSAVGETEGELVGSLNVSGAGVYELDITDIAAKNLGKTLNFLIKAKRAVSDAYSYEGKDYSFGSRISHSEVADGDSTVYKVIVGSNSGYTVPGYDEKKNVFYSNLTTAFSNNKILGTSKITTDDMGRRFTVSVKVLDSVSRVVMLSLNDTNNKTEKTIDLTSQRYNFKTVAGEWTTLTFEYIVYEPSYGDTVGSQVKNLTVSVSPTGDTNKPMWFGDTTVTETLTDISITDAYISVYDDGYTYKADSTEGLFLVGDTYYDSFAAALAAAGDGGTVTLTQNYTVDSAATAFEIGGATSVTVDLNGYSVRAVGASAVNLAATNKDALTATIKNGTVYLYNNAFLGYASQTSGAAGKSVNINLENLSISNVDGSRLTGFITEKALTKDVCVDVNVSLTDCDLRVDAYSNINVNFEIFGAGTNNLFVKYNVTGGTLTLDSFARAYLTKDTGSVSYVKDADGEYMKLILSAGTPAPAKRLSAFTDVYGEFKLSEVSGLVATYAIVTGENSTKYGVIPEEYSDADVYPFVYFDNSGTFRGATTQLYGTENGAFTKCKNLNSQKNVWDETNETYGARPYASFILMRRDYTISDTEYDWNFAQSQGTTTLDLNGFTLTKNSTSSSKTKVVFPGTAKANTGSGDAYTYPSSFVIMNGKIVTNAPLLSVNTYGTTYDLTKKVMNFTFNDLEIVAAEGTTATRFLHQIDTAPSGTKGPAIFNVEYNDCTFDLRGYTSPASDTRLFNVDCADGTMINMALRVNGGAIKANDFANIALTTLDTYYGSSITFDKGENGTYTSVELAETATVAPSGTVITPEGGKVYSKKASADGIDTYLLSGLMTEYGAVPDEYTDETVYPLLVFDTNGNFRYAATEFYGSNGADSAVGRAIYDILAANVWDSSNKTYGSSEVGAIIMFRADYTIGSAETFDNLSYAQGTLTFDLNGFTLTQGSDWTFKPTLKAWSESGDASIFPSSFVLKDGKLVNNNNANLLFNTNGISSTVDYSDKAMTWEFDNVKFEIAAGGSANGVLMGCYFATSYVARIPHTVILRDCVIDTRNTSATAVRVFSNLASKSLQCDIKVYGGEFYGNNLYSTANNVCTLDTANDAALRGTITLYRGSDGEYTKLYLANDAANTPNTACSTADGTMYYAKFETGDTESRYELTKLDTSYGTIPTEYASVEDYPFAVFKDGTFLGAYAYFEDAYDGDVNSAIEKAKGQMHGASGAGKTVTILMRRDFVNLDGVGAGGTNTLGRYYNYAQIGGVLNIDLGGYTLTAGTWMLFQLSAKKVNEAIFDTTINVKNGTLHTGNKVLIAVESSSTDYSSLGTKVFKMTFEDVTIGHSPNYSTEKASIILNNTTNANPVKLDVTFKNCVFDYESHSSGTKVTLLDFKKNGGVSLDAEFIGGEFRMSTFTNYNIATLDTDDVLVFSPDSNGNYTKANVTNGGAITTTDYLNDNDVTVNFGLMNDTSTVDTYELMDLNTEYGKIPQQYANSEVYPFVIFDKNGFRYAEKVFYGAQAGASAIGRARSILVSSNAWDAENKTYGEGANYAIILVRSDYTIASSEYYNNLAQMQGTVTVDLNGCTLTAANDKYMFEPTIKRWPAADSGDAAEVFPTTVIIKNGTLVSVNKSLIAFNTMSSSTINLYEKRFTWQFDDVTFKNIGSAANPFLACFYQTGLVKIPTPVIYNNCTFDLSNVTSAKSVFNIDPGHDIQLQITVNGGKIIAPVNIAHLDVLRKIDTNGSTIMFSSGDDGFIKLITADAYTNSEALQTSLGSSSFVKVGTSDGKNVYSLVPKALTGFTPKMSLTLDRNLIMNVYIPVEGLQKFTLDGTEYANLLALAENVVTLDDGKDYYLIKIELPAKSAARAVSLTATVSADELTSNVSFTFGIAKYAEKILADAEITDTEKTLVRDVLQYIRAAYAYFGTEDAEQMAKIDTLLGDYVSKPTVEGSDAADTTGMKSATLVLSGKPSIRFYFAEGANTSAYKFYIGGKEVNAIVSEDGTYVDIDVYAYALCETVTYTVDGEAAGSFHINAYYAFVSGTGENSYAGADKEALTALTECFWKYLQSARAYRESVVEN